MVAIFNSNGLTATGIDMDSHNLQYGQAQGLHLNTTPIQGTYDWVILSHVVEHVRDPLTFLKSILSHLYPKGRLYIEVPYIHPTLHPHFDFWTQLQNAHAWYFDLPQLRALLARCGLRVIFSDHPFHLRVVAERGPATWPSLRSPTAILRLLKSVEWINQVKRTIRHGWWRRRF